MGVGRIPSGIGIVHDTTTTAGIDDDCGAYGSGLAAEKQCYDHFGCC
jgi:hypothetical protein